MNEDMRRTLLGAYRELLRRADAVGPVSEAPEDLEAFGEVKDYLLGQVERLESAEVTA